MNWFGDALRQYMVAKAIATGEALADNLGENKATVHRWLNGLSMPKNTKLVRILKDIGGDIERALPDYVPPGPMAPLQLVGTVQAGSSQFTQSELEIEESLNFLWSNTSAWHCSTGPVQYVRVIGDSMEPIYPEGCLIAIRNWRPGASVPHSTPVIFIDETTKSCTFKLYQERRRGKITLLIGVPINPRHEALVWKESEATVHKIVLGKAEALSAREIRQNLGAMIMRDSSDEG